MPGFVVRHRTTAPWKEDVIDAPTREEAIHEVLNAAEEGMEVEVSTVTEVPLTAEPTSTAKKEKEKEKEEAHHAKK